MAKSAVVCNRTSIYDTYQEQMDMINDLELLLELCLTLNYGACIELA